MRISDIKLLADRGYEIIGNGEPVGEGAYSKVQLFHSKHLNKSVAIKIINKSSAPRDFVQHFLPREIEVLQRVRHAYIVEIFEILATNDGRVFIAMEYAEHCDLLRHIQQNGALDEDRSKFLFYQLAEAIKYLHNKKIVHRDLKCENLLLTNLPGSGSSAADKKISPPSVINSVGQTLLPQMFDMDRVKLIVADFGFSKRFEREDERSRTFCGSAAYAAPEIIKGDPYILKNHDMWSLGVILFIMACGTMPYDDSNVRRMLKDQLERRIRLPPSAAERLSPNCKDLINKLIEPDVDRRYNIDQVLSHKWLAGTVKKHQEVSRARESAVPLAVDNPKTSLVEKQRKSDTSEGKASSPINRTSDMVSEERQSRLSKNSSPKFWW